MTEGKLQPFNLTATGYNINYLPEYIALRHGFFREQGKHYGCGTLECKPSTDIFILPLGLDVKVTIPTPWDGVLDHLAEGSADMALGGIWGKCHDSCNPRVLQYKTRFSRLLQRPCAGALSGSTMLNCREREKRVFGTTFETPANHTSIISSHVYVPRKGQAIHGLRADRQPMPPRPAPPSLARTLQASRRRGQNGAHEVYRRS